MIPGMSSRDVQRAMKKLGIKQEEIDANEVIIRTDDKEIVISNPRVSKVNMMGQETFQIIGEAEERQISSEADISDEDIKTVMEQAGVTEEKAREAIENSNYDLAKAIISLRNQ